MDIFTAMGLGVVTAVLALSLKNRPDISVLISIAGGVIILLGFLPQVAGIVDSVRRIAAHGGIDSEYVVVILKAAGIAILVTVCSSVCRDAGQTALAVKVEIAGRIAILAVAMPVIDNLFRVISSAMR